MGSVSGIADGSKPNAGRMYDYFLGGNHNFEVDRQAAEQVLKMIPSAPASAKLVRWFLGEAAIRLGQEGYRHFLDFASGLPTMGHIHEFAPEGSKVIYSDIDPVTVAYAQEIIGDNPDIRYVQCDIRKPETLLDSGIVEELFGDERDVAIGVNGIVYFLPDEAVTHFMQVLYDWSGEGARLFLCDSDSETTNLTEAGKKIFEIYEKMGTPFYSRSLEGILELVSPWKVDDQGARLLEEWVELGDKMTNTITEEWGTGMERGMFLVK